MIAWVAATMAVRETVPPTPSMGVTITWSASSVSGEERRSVRTQTVAGPTAIRTTGMGAASAVGRLGAIVTPITIGYLYAGVGFTNVFLTLVGALALAVAVIVAFGEKTAGRSLEHLEGTPA